MLRQNGFSAEQVEAIVTDFRRAGLSPAEVAMMAYAQKIVRDATSVTQRDIDELRGHGFSDAEILDITLVATARAFFSKTVDALGAEPESAILEQEPELRRTLAVGRPVP